MMVSRLLLDAKLNNDLVNRLRRQFGLNLKNSSMLEKKLERKKIQ